MAIVNLNPYLNFAGNAAEAIALYERALGAKTSDLGRYGDVPGMDVASEHRDRVMHAKLAIGPGVVMVSDMRPGTAAPNDSNSQVCLHFDDVADMRAKFDALAQGGKVTMPLQDTFWGATFGMLVDAFGIHWMFNCDKK